MTIYFAGGEMGAYIPSDSNAIERTASGSYDATFSRCGIGPRGSSSYAESASFTALNDIWVHFALTDGAGSGGSSAIQALTLTNAAGTDLFRVKWDINAGTVAMERWNGSAWVAVGSSFSINVEIDVQQIDLHVVGNSATGSADLYVAGTQRATASSVDLSLVASITKLRHYGRGTVSDIAVSQVVVANESTIGMRVFTVPVSGAGASSDWTGSFANIDEVAYSDADFINSATANQVSTFAVSAPTLTGYSVRAVAVTARAKRGSSGPANLQLALRSSGTTYFSSSIAQGLGYGANVNVWETDPATGAAWINTAVSSVQPGVKSIT